MAMKGASFDVKELHHSLTSVKTSERKSGINSLKSWLEIKDFLLRLDETTQTLSQSAQLTPTQASWPAICHSLCKCISLELAASGRRREEPAGKGAKERIRKQKQDSDELLVASSLRVFVQAAENSAKRSKLLHPLQRKSKRLFATVVTEIERQTLSSVTGRELNELLRLHLLHKTEYCANVDSAIKQKLIVQYLKWLNHANYLSHKEEFYRNVDTLRLILMHLRGDVCKTVRNDLCEFFRATFKFLDNYSKVGYSVFKTLNVFLFKHRFDLCSKLDALSSLPYRLIRGTWDKSRHRGYRIAICEYIELDLLYNRADKRSSILTELLHLTSKDLDSVGKEVFLSELCCARQYISTAAIIAKNVLSLNFSPLKESIQSSGKRQKRGSWATVLWGEAMVCPDKWGPVLCTLLRRHAKGIPFEIFFDWLRLLSLKLGEENALPNTGKSKSSLLWLMRIASHLALGFGEALHSSRSGMTAEAGEIWSGVYGKVARWLIASAAASPLSEEVLMVLSGISLLGQAGYSSLDEILCAKVQERCSGLHFTLFLASSLCLPNKRVYLGIEEHVKGLPELIWQSARDQALAGLHLDLWDRAVARLAYLLCLGLPDSESIWDLREISMALSSHWFTSKEADDVCAGRGNISNAELVPNGFMDGVSEPQGKKTGPKRDSPTLRSSPLARELLHFLASRLDGLAQTDAKQVMLVCGMLAKFGKRAKCMLQGLPKESSKDRAAGAIKLQESINCSLMALCRALPQAVETLLSSPSGREVEKTLRSVIALLSDMNALEDLKNPKIEAYNKVTLSISIAVKKMLRSYDPYSGSPMESSEEGKENLDLDFEFEDSGSKRITSALFQTQKCVKLLAAALEKIGRLCPEPAYESLCEMRSLFDFDVSTEIAVLHRMCSVAMFLKQMREDPFKSLFQIHETRQNLSTQFLVLESFMTLFESASNDQAKLIYDSGIQLLKGIERWMMENESTVALRISLGKMLESLIRIDAVRCHEEGLDEILLVLVRDECYLVRLEAAKQIGILFDSWQDHVQVFRTISGYLMLPPCQDLLETSDCALEDVEEILTSVFALAYFARKSKKIESYCMVVIFAVMVSTFSNKLLLACASEIMENLGGRFGYTLAQYFSLFQPTLFANLNKSFRVKSEMILSEGFKCLGTSFFLEETTLVKHTFLGNLFGCVQKRDRDRIAARFDLTSHRSHPEVVVRSWILHLLISYRSRVDKATSAREFTQDWLSAEAKNFSHKLNVVENMVVAVSTILECVAHSPELTPCVSAGEGTDVIFALFSFSDYSNDFVNHEGQSFYDNVVALALCRVKSRINATSFHHRRSHFYAIQSLADLLGELERTWSTTTVYAMRICTENLEFQGVAERLILDILEKLISTHTKKRGAVNEDFQLELYITIARLCAIINRIRGEEGGSRHAAAQAKISKIIDCCLECFESVCLSAENTLFNVREVLSNTTLDSLESQIFKSWTGYQPLSLIQRLKELSKLSQVVPADVLNQSAKRLVCSIEELDFAGDLEGKILARDCCLNLIQNNENLSWEAQSALSRILALTGPLTSPAAGTCSADESPGTSPRMRSPKSIANREMHKMSIDSATLTLVHSWVSHSDPILAYESLFSLVSLRDSRDARAASKELAGGTRKFLRLVWDFAKKHFSVSEDRSSSSLACDETLFDESCWSGGCQIQERIHKICENLLSFCQSEVLLHCKNLVARNPRVCTSILPLVIEDISLHNPSKSIICGQISRALEAHVFREGTCSSLVDEFLSILERLRVLYFSYQKHSKQDRSRWRSCYWFDVDYLDVANVALSRNQYFTALLNIEQWYEREYETFSDLETTKSQEKECSKLKSLKSIETMLINIFKGIGESDGVYAFATNIDLETQLRIFEHEGKWDKALQTYDILLSSNVQSPEHYEADMANCMKNLGCSYLANMCGREAHKASDRLTEEQYEKAWHECTWTLPLVGSSEKETPKLNQSVYNGLYALKVEDSAFFKTSETILRKSAILNLRGKGKESAAIANDSIVVLQMVELLSKSFGVKKSTEASALNWDSGDLNHYKGGTYLKWERFGGYQQSDLEDSYALLKPLFKLYASTLTALDCKVGLQQAYLYEAQVSRRAKDLTESTANMGIVKRLCRSRELDRSFEIETKLEEIRNLWDQGLERIALNECKKLYTIATQGESGEGKRAFSYLQISATSMLLGKWLAISGSESADEISKILTTSVHFASAAHKKEENRESRFMVCNAHFNLAQFCDKQYRGIEKEQNSPEWQARQRLLALTDKQLELLTRKKGSRKSSADRDFLHYKTMATRFHEEDQQEAHRVEVSKDSFLKMSLEHYIQTLTTGDAHDIQVVFRLCQLWFKLRSNVSVNQRMDKLSDEVATHKFLCLMYQIGSRLGPVQATGSTSFESAVSKLLTKMCFDHPYHTLPHIFAFCHAGRGKDGTHKDAKANSGYAVDKTKVLAAKAILEKVKRKDSVARARLKDLQKIIDAYIHLAVLPVKKTGGEALGPHMPRAVKELGNLVHAPIVTKTMPVDTTCRYAKDHFAHFVQFKNEVKLVGGINAPKLVTAVDSHGNEHLQLAKSGNDDLRQDAVMQQLFNLVNHLLEACAKTRKRRLGLQTYNVIPLTPAAGLVEWVKESIPLMTYLVGDPHSSNGAHRRLRQQDWTYQQCLGYLYKQQNSRAATKKEAFARICGNFKPVMHHFFLERYASTTEWFQRRLAYTRSIAASSMVGYVVGLGDRHASNILIHERTAEVIHIDLGIAFEQGRVSKIPETVPFRLTRDIVDGMGVSGVEGTMRRCSEDVMEVLRTNKDLVLTIVEVFIHDPLYRWALSPVKAILGQLGEKDAHESLDSLASSRLDLSGSAHTSNADAERAILKVKEKLEGLENGERMSVQGQVQQLLREAQDPDNLSLLYCGWGPWL